MNDEYWLPYCLEASRGFFDRYVIYDVGSSDKTTEIIKWFAESQCRDAEFFVRVTDKLPPRIQGIFRNSMIAEARSEWYMILDADEIYTPESFEKILEQTEKLNDQYKDGKMYGVLPRVEVAGDLKSAYGLNRAIPHHRIYHRTAIWKGNHPGEVPYYTQKESREMWFHDVTCYHFHNAERSTKDDEVPKRKERKARGTYRPGDPEPFKLLQEVPLLRHHIGDFPACPALKQLRND